MRARAREATIYVLNGFTPDWGDGLIEINARPVINSTTELAEWDAFVAAHAGSGGAALHVDTGMNRLGISPEEAAALAPRVQTENHGIALLMSHLACAEIPDHPLNAAQIQLFRELRMLYPGIPASLANSSGIFLGDSAHFDLARPGAALYGVNPTPGRPNPMQSVVELTGRILQIRSVERDETVGYGATWTAKRASRIAVVALGYADGLMRAGSGTDDRPGGAAIIAGKRCPIVGRISMDLVCIDITDLPDGAVHRGDLATFIGADISVDEVAASAGTIGYEILTRLGPRCHLVYRGAEMHDMAARAQNFVCQNCGAAFARWAGNCEACGEWNTLVEEGAERRAARVAARAGCSPSSRSRARRTKRRGSPPASPNSTA